MVSKSYHTSFTSRECSISLLVDLSWLIVLFIFVIFSVWLAKYNFDIHHDGFVLSQTDRLLHGEKPYNDVFLQYGLLFHYIMAILLKIGGHDPLISRYFGIGLIAIISLLFFMSCHDRSIEVNFSLLLWLINCYWNSQFVQYYVQFHPSQLALLFFVLSYYLLIKAIDGGKITKKIAFFLALNAFLATYSKINFGFMLTLAVIASLIYLESFRWVLRYYLFYLFAMHVAMVIVCEYIGIDIFNGLFAFGYKFVMQSGLVPGIKNLIWLNTDHGNVFRYQRLIYLLPIILLGMSFCCKKNLNKYFDIIYNDKKIIFTCIFAIFLWLTIFPTGSFQHIWYASIFGIYINVILISNLLPTKYTILLFIGVFISTFLFVAEQLSIKLIGLNNFDNSVKVDGSYFESLLVSPKVRDVYSYIQKISKKNHYKILNLTDSAFYVRDYYNIISANSNRRGFTWISYFDSDYDDFSRKLLSHEGVIISKFDNLDIILKSAVHIKDLPCDFAKDFNAYNGLVAQIEKPFNGIIKSYINESGAEYYITFNDNLDYLSDNIFLLVGDSLYYTLECSTADKIFAHDSSLFQKKTYHDNICQLNANVNNISHIVSIMEYMELLYSIHPDNVVDLSKSDGTICDGCGHLTYKKYKFFLKFNNIFKNSNLARNEFIAYNNFNKVRLLIRHSNKLLVVYHTVP